MRAGLARPEEIAAFDLPAPLTEPYLRCEIGKRHRLAGDAVEDRELTPCHAVEDPVEERHELGGDWQLGPVRIESAAEQHDTGAPHRPRRAARSGEDAGAS